MITKCEFCGTIGAQHNGVFSCVNDLVSQLKRTKSKLRKAENLLFYVVTEGMLDAFKNDYDINDKDAQFIEEIERFTGFDDD